MPPQQTSGMNQPMGSMGSAMPQPPKTTKPVGPVVGIVIIVLVLILGALYFWGSKLSSIPGVSDFMSTPDAQTESLKTQSSSDVVADIEADLNATDLDGLDREVSDIGAGLAQ